MKEYNSIHEVSFQDVLEILQKWERGILQFDKVQAWAEDIIALGWHEYDNHDPRSLLASVIGMLDFMYDKPILKQDAPMLQHILHQALESPTNAWTSLNDFVASRDWNSRKLRASENIRKFQSPRLDSMSDL